MGSPISRETFLQRAERRFGDRFDYSGMLYKSFKTPIRIRCTLHPVREISITPERHLETTGGCRYCLREKRIAMLERELGREAARPASSEAEQRKSTDLQPPQREIRVSSSINSSPIRAVSASREGERIGGAMRLHQP